MAIQDGNFWRHFAAAVVSVQRSLHRVVGVDLCGVLGEGASARDAKAPGLTRRGEGGGAVAALLGESLAEANVLVGRVERHRVGPPEPAVLRREVLEEVELGRPVPAKESEGGRKESEGVARSRKESEGVERNQIESEKVRGANQKPSEAMSSNQQQSEAYWPQRNG